MLEQTERIEAAVVELRAHANPYAKAILQKGEITSISEQDANVFVVAEEGGCQISGTITAVERTKGGKVHILGDAVHLLPKASIAVSAPSEGGEVLIGGDYQGKNPLIKNAQMTWVGENTNVSANATKQGDGGGRVILWSDKATYFYGNIESYGGNEGGNGGFAEVSGKNLEYHGYADLSAPKDNVGIFY